MFSKNFMLNGKGSSYDNMACEEYEKLNVENMVSIKREDLPDEFSDLAFKTIDEFIKKTFLLDYECLLYFDYVSGEILNCAIGESTTVQLTFDDGEFDGYNVASIHNHPLKVFSPPSSKNFGILGRDFEDYELIASRDGLWILKAKGLYLDLIHEFNLISELLFLACLERCSKRYWADEVANKMVDVIYGNQLSKYINDKNINDIQLTKTEYVNMSDNLNIQTAEYGCRKWITDPEVFRLARERERDPNILSGKDRIYAIYKMMGMEIDYDEIFAELP